MTQIENILKDKHYFSICLKFKAFLHKKLVLLSNRDISCEFKNQNFYKKINLYQEKNNKIIIDY